jgi:hypothetical protein
MNVEIFIAPVFLLRALIVSKVNCSCDSPVCSSGSSFWPLCTNASNRRVYRKRSGGSGRTGLSGAVSQSVSQSAGAASQVTTEQGSARCSGMQQQPCDR